MWAKIPRLVSGLVQLMLFVFPCYPLPQPQPPSPQKKKSGERTVAVISVCLSSYLLNLSSEIDVTYVLQIFL
jgi:hypothetical protein